MIKINRLEIENVKKIKATKIIPANSGLTVIGGKNGQGKTSVLDAIAWALGGERYRPSQSQRAESVLPPYIHAVRTAADIAAGVAARGHARAAARDAMRDAAGDAALAAECLLVRHLIDPKHLAYALRQIRLLQRWVNNRIIFKSVPRFEDYDARRCNIDA